MNRRELLLLLGGAMTAPLGTAVPWSWVANAERPVMPVVGVLRASQPASPIEREDPAKSGFRDGLAHGGYVEGQNVAIEYRTGEGHYDRLRALADDLVRQRVAVIVALAMPSALAAKQATKTIPIVFWVTDDPIKHGLVASLSHPGGNATGISVLSVGLTAKRLELLHQLVPKAPLIALLVNPTNPNVSSHVDEAKDASRALGRRIEILRAGTQPEIEAVFASLAGRQVGGLAIDSDGVFFSLRSKISVLVVRYAVPAIFEWREYVEMGGLASYGTNFRDSYRQVALYTGKILDGAKPADLPVQQPTKFELVINLKTAKALRLTVSPSILARADEVIE